MQPSTIIQIRELLRTKFPGLRTRADELPVKTRDRWASGIHKLDEQLCGGFPRRALSEIIAPRRGCGSALLLLQLLRNAAATHQFSALVDGLDCFDATAVDPQTLSHLLWIRCHTAEDAIKATDLVLRDGNLPVVLVDLALNPDGQLRKIPAPTWYRFQRIVEESAATCIILTPRPMISPAQVRVTLRSRFALEHVEADQMKLTLALDFDVSEGRTSEELLRRSA